ncbi:antibiotic biosynthesis monooxygenase [Sphaerisporangium sp. TRM90804]|uniref:antibiotic biosynthesis monooxygenase n=1 Tax=Sphaerisporangium sp. TRM90804 TaxID=3031113 RepID=UPI00244794CB|nr:antibiotic biosynthesis monooxygenase [Sphaerisporangium sp. TRM90804]MDH2427529.1 antibiotic biosynthesis monooxygenase [Sphaerisporangium sp. TRM90804]
MASVGLLVRLYARPGKEHLVARLLRDVLDQVEEEHETTAWFAVRINCTTFGVFDVFDDDDARRAHLAGRVVGALQARSDEFLSRPATIERVDVLAAKLPAGASARLPV